MSDTYRILKAFDFYQAGQEMNADDVAEQTKRGNMADLIRNGYIAKISQPVMPEELPDYEAMSYRDLQQAAKSAGVKATGKREDIIKALKDGDN